MENYDELLAARRQKLDALRAKGIRPYGSRFPKAQPIHKTVESFVEGAPAIVAGRLLARRGHGGIAFADVRDDDAKIQLCFRKNELGNAYELLEHLDIGDWLGAEGTLFKTKAGEITVNVQRFSVLSKSLRPLPEKWHGLKDVEIRYRKRYLDLAVNDAVRKVFQGRATLVDSLRATLRRHGYLEVETPMMHQLAGGAAGEPFATHHKALDLPLYLRLAPELHLKRLLVGGFEKVYELNRSFRNEGISTKHNPEFTMLEAYCAYEDEAYMRRLVEELIKEAAKATLGGLQFEYQGQSIDLGKPWEVVSFTELLRQGYGLEPGDGLDAMREKLKHPKTGFKAIDLKAPSRMQLLNAIEELIEPREKDVPVFVTDHWAEISPLAKSRPDNPLIAERFELYIGKFEVANAYSEQNDPDEQRRRFEAQLKDQSAIRNPQSEMRKGIDEDFVEALEYGMPPAAGLGLGVDRLTMLLLNQPSIKDVILFPLLKTNEEGGA